MIQRCGWCYGKARGLDPSGRCSRKHCRRMARPKHGREEAKEALLLGLGLAGAAKACNRTKESVRQMAAQRFEPLSIVLGVTVGLLGR